MQEYGKRIKELRIQRGETQEQLANMLGVSLRTYTNYENGKTKMRIKYLIMLAQYYSVSTDYILGLVDN